MSSRENCEFTDILIQLEQIDYASIVQMLSPIISFYVTKRVLDGYKLHKDFKPKNISKILLPPELAHEYSSVDIEKLASQCFGDTVIEFAKFVMNKFPSKDLTNFYNNLNELKVVPKKFGFKTNIVGSYDVRENKIQIDNGGYASAIFHELFHMASTIYKDDICYSGFCQISSKLGVNLGFSLNEGYTELLTKRYFGHVTELPKSYVVEVHIASKLEEIVGQEKMESLYLNADLPGLINELKKYAYEEEIMNFISGTDFLTEHIGDKKLLPFEKGMITNSLKNINEFLLKAYTIKLKIQLYNRIIDLNEFEEKINMYIFSLGNNLKYGKYNYEFLTPERVQEIVGIILDSSDITVTMKSLDEHISKGR